MRASEEACCRAGARDEAGRTGVDGVEAAVPGAHPGQGHVGDLPERGELRIRRYREGDEVARIIEQDPLIVTGDVNQTEIHAIKPGSMGKVTLVTGQTASAQVRYIANEASPATRTFRVELELANPNNSLMAGVTSEIRITTETIPAHRLSPALLALHDNGEVGVKIVDANNRVIFQAIEIVRADSDSIWVTGLPAQARIITIGQGFVRAGELVKPSSESETETILPTQQRDPS